MNTATMLLLLFQGALPPPVTARAAASFRASATGGSYRAQARP